MTVGLPEPDGCRQQNIIMDFKHLLLKAVECGDSPQRL